MWVLTFQFSVPLSGSIDFYHKYTTDLLGTRNADPTLGWATLFRTYGTMYNRGVEISLRIIDWKLKTLLGVLILHFTMTNKLLNLEGTKESVSCRITLLTM